MPRKMSIVLVVLAFAAYGASQTLQTRKVHTPPEVHKLTFGQLAVAAKMYLRDSAEFPLSMDLVMVTINTSGRTIKKEHATGVYHFHGYNPRSGHGSSDGHLNGSLFNPHRAMMPALSNSVLAPALPSFFLPFSDPGHPRTPSGRGSFEVRRAGLATLFSVDSAGPSADRQFVTARMSPRPGACVDFKWLTKKEVPADLCGSGRFKLQKDDLSLQHFSFDAGALPIAATVKPFGRCQLRSYHAEVEFQKVMLPDDPTPFLVPKHVEVVIETDKGKFDITTEFTPRK